MAETIKVLGQANPSATTLTDVYTVPASTVAVLSTVVVCNRGGAGIAFRVSVAVAGASDSNEQYLYYDEALAANTTVEKKLGVTLGAADVVRVYVDTATMSVNVFGVEIT
jgi:hypothetical protein